MSKIEQQICNIFHQQDIIARQQLNSWEFWKIVFIIFIVLGAIEILKFAIPKFLEKYPSYYAWKTRWTLLDEWKFRKSRREDERDRWRSED